MPDAFVYSAVRTPVGRHGGVLAEIRPDDLAAAAVRAAVDRVGFDPARLDDVILGCANQAGEDNRNIARMAALLAGFPVEVPGQTVNRLCGSGLQAAASAAQAVKAGEGEAFVAGGVESMTRAPYVVLKRGTAWDRTPPETADSTVGWRFTNPRMPAAWTISLGRTAEVIARRYGIGRREQDAFALESQRRASEATRAGVFVDEIVPLEVGGADRPAGERADGTPRIRKGGPSSGRSVVGDEAPRPDVTLEQLAKLPPAFEEGGTVTAATSSGINDGAAALLVGTPTIGSSCRPNTAPIARIVTTAVAGVDPGCMGLGPIPATRKALARAGLSVADLDLIELNEAFAAQAIACIRELAFDPTKVNIYGGAIALGHPLGATGAKILTTLVHGLRRVGGRYGLATMCIGVGQGIAMIVERV